MQAHYLCLFLRHIRETPHQQGKARKENLVNNIKYILLDIIN
jgi:hypothetical protein